MLDEASTFEESKRGPWSVGEDIAQVGGPRAHQGSAPPRRAAPVRCGLVHGQGIETVKRRVCAGKLGWTEAGLGAASSGMG